MIRIQNDGRNKGPAWQDVYSHKHRHRYYGKEFYLEGMPKDTKLYTYIKDENCKAILYRNKTVSTIKWKEIKFLGSQVNISTSSKQPFRKIYRSPSFGKLTILYKGVVAEVFLNGKRVGAFNTIGYFFNKCWYRKQCKKKDIVPLKKLDNCLFEFDETLIHPALIVLIVRLIYGSELEMA